MTDDDLPLRIADLADAGLLFVDDERVIGRANEVAHRLLGRPASGLVGRTVLEAFLDHRVGEVLEEARDHGAAERELSLGGEPQRTLLLKAGRGPTGGWWVVLRDLSELRRLQRIRTEFVDNLSHELRTPVTNLRLLAETLTDEIQSADVSARLSESVARIDGETDRLAHMVTELLDLARIEQGDIPLRRERFDMADVIAGVVERLKPFADRQGVRLATDVPAEPEARSVVGDQGRIEQLLVNVVQNALKYSTPDADAQVSISERPDQANPGFVLIEVSDDGPGIARRDLERIFERFFKVDRARTRGGLGGTGLGLSIARHIAEAHGGRIWAESEEGAGATFFVALPRG